MAQLTNISTFSPADLAAQIASVPGETSMQDRTAIRNERIKLACGFLNAVALTLIAIALLKPITQDISALTPMSALWVLLSLALHGAAHLLLGRLETPSA